MVFFSDNFHTIIICFFIAHTTCNMDKNYCKTLPGPFFASKQMSLFPSKVEVVFEIIRSIVIERGSNFFMFSLKARAEETRIRKYLVERFQVFVISFFSYDQPDTQYIIVEYNIILIKIDRKSFGSKNSDNRDGRKK